MKNEIRMTGNIPVMYCYAMRRKAENHFVYKSDNHFMLHQFFFDSYLKLRIIELQFFFNHL